MRPYYRPIVTICRHMSSQAKGSTPKSSTGSTKSQSTTSTPTATSSGQIDDGTYKSPEYYGHDINTFYDLMVTQSKYRLTQPSNKS
ncbi:NADH dehydrogenase [ubiquinone] flavoprotein 3, mitochondrial-like [Oppia nitens]|uniref:NADH dehydrogenase [ubiquinone] flavoprotein 3, mitochondrial-like n=1 Tax=Oppia nitens TaxID=1686743 RepID=UPI0023DA968B|nr:NADH dehydrogenase [ubiquinone] flavoprotein 3, mitochondrial-like [Oppia nitens]